MLAGGAPKGRLLDGVVSLLKGLGADVRSELPGDGDEKHAAFVFDATGITTSTTKPSPSARSSTAPSRGAITGCLPSSSCAVRSSVQYARARASSSAAHRVRVSVVDNASAYGRFRRPHVAR